VIDRASTFADPEIVNFLKTRTIPVAIDQWNQRRQKDSEGDFYRKIASQGPRHDFENGTTQGLYLASADGTFLGYTNNRHPDRIRQFLNESIGKHRATATGKLKVQTQDKRYTYRPPEGGLVVRVHAKVLGGYDVPTRPFEEIFQTAVSRDNFWITRDEHQQLAARTFPETVALRLIRYHLVDNTRGEPPHWERAEVVSHEFDIVNENISGKVELRSKDGKRGYTAELRGELAAADGKLTKFNIVALGQFFGEGQYTGGAPKGKFPLAVSFTLADGTDIADSIPPQHARGWVEDYLR